MLLPGVATVHRPARRYWLLLRRNGYQPPYRATRALCNVQYHPSDRAMRAVEYPVQNLYTTVLCLLCFMPSTTLCKVLRRYYRNCRTHCPVLSAVSYCCLVLSARTCSYQATTTVTRRRSQGTCTTSSRYRTILLAFDESSTPPRKICNFLQVRPRH